MSNLKYINVSKKRLVGRSNQTVPPLCIDYSTLFDISFQFIDERNQIIPLDSSLSGFAFAGSLKMGDMSTNLLWLCQDFSIENDTLTFHDVNTFTVPFMAQIKKKNTEVNIEISQMSLNTKKVWLRDFALCEPRVWVAGLSPAEVDSQAYYTKVEVNELVDSVAASTLSSAQAYADGQDAATLASATAYTDEQIEHLEISGYVTDEELEAAKAELDGKIALKADEADLQVVSGAADTNSENIQTLSGDVDALELVVSNKAEKSVVDTISGDLDTHEADSTIHVTAADKTAWNAKAEVSDIPTDNAQLTNGAGYQTAQDVQNAISGKAETSYVDTELAKKQDLIDESNPISGNAVLVTYDPWTGDPEFTAESAINMAHAEALQAQADATQANADIQIVSGALDEKQDIIDGNNPLDAAYVRMDLDPYSGGDPDFDVETAVNMVHAEALEALSGLSGKLDIPSGGTSGQILTKTADGAEWADAQGGAGVDNTDYLTFTATQANSTVALNKSADNASLSAVLEYSTDGETWTNYEWSGTSGTVITLANVGDYVMLRGDNATFSIDNNNYYKFVMTGKVNASGNIMSLLDKTCRKTDLPANYIFTSLFYQCSALYSAPKLPATKLSVSCYNGMFRGCTNLTSAPVLQATTLESGCYRTMFSECTKLVFAPDLPAKVVNSSAYEYMFFDCSNLEKGPKISAISISAYTCNSMFSSCRKLNSIKIDFKDLGVTPTMDWLRNVAASGTFYCPYGLDTSIRDESHIPAGWNVVYTEVPESVLSGATAAAEALTMING